MTILKTTLLAAASTVLFAQTALAADPVEQYDDWESPVVSSGFDWDGFYAGVGITGSALSNGGPNATRAYVDLIMGYNITHENILFGIEGWASGHESLSGSSSGFGAGIEARTGYLATDDLLLYAGVGGFFFDAGGRYGTLSLGTEFAVNDDVTIDANYKYWGWSNTGFSGHSVGVSANWHFN